MALKRILYGDFDEIIKTVEKGVFKGSISATLEDYADFHIDDVRSSVRVFERYSYIGSNRVSLTVTFLEVKKGEIHISAITAGGSQAMFWKINTWGEESFLSKFEEVLDKIQPKKYL